jgi:hypothetical protein
MTLVSTPPTSPFNPVRSRRRAGQQAPDQRESRDFRGFSSIRVTVQAPPQSKF